MHAFCCSCMFYINRSIDCVRREEGEIKEILEEFKVNLLSRWPKAKRNYMLSRCTGFKDPVDDFNRNFHTNPMAYFHKHASWSLQGWMEGATRRSRDVKEKRMQGEGLTKGQDRCEYSDAVRRYLTRHWTEGITRAFDFLPDNSIAGLVLAYCPSPFPDVIHGPYDDSVRLIMDQYLSNKRMPLYTDPDDVQSVFPHYDDGYVDRYLDESEYEDEEGRQTDFDHIGTSGFLDRIHERMFIVPFSFVVYYSHYRVHDLI